MTTDHQPREPDAGAAAARAVIERKLGYRFRDPRLLQLALVHASSTTRHEPDNERMEFLGDAVLDLVVCEFLFDFFPRKQEGELTRIKSVLVQGQTLAGFCRRLRLCEHIRLGGGISPHHLPDSVCANVFESLVAAIYRDGGYEPARAFALAQIRDSGRLRQLVDGEDGNSKARLQEFTQKHCGVLPVYSVADASGPEHAKTFVVEVAVAGRVYGVGRGCSKKEAEQAAAAAAFERIAEKGPASQGDESPGNQPPGEEKHG